MRPASVPASLPVPQKKSARAAPRIAPPVSCAAISTCTPAVVKVLDVPLSLQNRNLASQTALLFRSGVMMTRSRLVRRHRQYRALYAKPPRALPTWCRPPIAAMAELMQSLRLRRG